MKSQIQNNLSSKTYHLKSSRGFTLVEMLVVVGIFSMIVVMVTGIFLSGTRIRQRVVGGDQVVEEGRHVLDDMVRRLRFGHLDYTWYVSRSTSSATDLVFYTQDNQHIFVRRSPQLCYGNTTTCLEMSVDDQVSWMPVTPQGLSMDDFKLYISPALDPFLKNSQGGFSNAPEQPRVTIVARLRVPGRGGRTSEELSVPFQTTVIPRYYAR